MSEKYRIDENMVKPSFEMESVLQSSVSYTYCRLYTFASKHNLSGLTAANGALFRGQHSMLLVCRGLK